MCRFVFILVAVAAATLHAAQPSLLPGESVCGYLQNYEQRRVGEINEGLAVELLAGDITAGSTVPLRFRVSEKPRDVPVDDLHIEHEKLMHVIGVSADLREFIHIHPLRVASGLWQTEFTFTNAGRYQFWADVKRRGRVYTFAQPPITVGGRTNQSTYSQADTRLETIVAGNRVRLLSPDKIVTGVSNQFQVVIENSEGNRIGTDFFLGAALHVIIIKDDLATYSHAHADNHQRGERDIYFSHTFQSAGRYKVFAQFRPMKSKLPPDEAVLAEFFLKVEAKPR